MTPWVTVARAYRNMWISQPSAIESPAARALTAKAWAPTLREYLVLNTLRERRNSDKGLPAGVSVRVEARAKARTMATLETMPFQEEVSFEVQEGFRQTALPSLNICEARLCSE